jgi:hypothetical protein
MFIHAGIKHTSFQTDLKYSNYKILEHMEGDSGALYLRRYDD